MKDFKDLFKNKKIVIGICLGLVLVSLLILLLFSLTEIKNINDNTDTTTKKVITITTNNVNENENELENNNNEDKNSNTTNSTKKTTTKKIQSNTNNENTQTTTKKSSESQNNTTKKSSESQNNTTKKWTVRFMCNGNLVTTKEVENNKTVSKPSTPTVPSGMEFKYWSLNGNKFDFNTKITNDYVISCSYGKIENSNSTEDNNINDAPTNIYFSNESFVGTTMQSRIEVTWDSVKNADSYHIYFSTSENGNYTEKIAVSTTKTRFVMEKDGYYKIQATNSDGKKGPMSKAIYVPANFTANISGSITCNTIYNTSTGHKVYNGGNISVNNSNNYNVRVLYTKNYNGEKSYTLEDDLGTTNSRAFSNACFGYGPINGYYQYYTVLAYKKGNNYFVYSNDKFEIKNFIENTTYVTN